MEVGLFGLELASARSDGGRLLEADVVCELVCAWRSWAWMVDNVGRLHDDQLQVRGGP